MLALISFLSAFSGLGTILLIAGGIGLILAFARANLAKSTIELQSQEIDAQSKRIETLESELSRANSQISDNCTKIQNLEGSLRALERVKTGADAIENLANEVRVLGTTILAKLNPL